MKLVLIREIFTHESTIGVLSVDGKFECYTLEDRVRPVKVAKKTAIPMGTYKVIVDYSNRFRRDMPHVLDVPNFKGIRIHSGNTAADTEGCILVGQIKGKNYIGGSRLAYKPLFKKINDAFQQKEEITIEIRGTFQESSSGVAHVSKAHKKI
jgi:Family of unknown function (DUF5675)